MIKNILCSTTDTKCNNKLEENKDLVDILECKECRYDLNAISKYKLGGYIPHTCTLITQLFIKYSSHESLIDNIKFLMKYGALMNFNPTGIESYSLLFHVDLKIKSAKQSADGYHKDKYLKQLNEVRNMVIMNP